jgi:PEP-CTERM motif
LGTSTSIPLGRYFQGGQVTRHAVSIAFAVMSLAIATSASALTDVFQTYDLAWSGAFLGNDASASGQITLDLTTLTNPSPLGGLGIDIVSDITSLTVTVTGASAGNGPFTESDLCACSTLGTSTLWNTNGATVDMHGDILAQLTVDGGDFNLFFTSPGPQGSQELTLTTNGLSGDPMEMTQFAPALGRAAAPEPATWMMMGLGFAGLAFAGLRARRSATAIA